MNRRMDRNDAQSYNRNQGYEDRFGTAGMKGSHRSAEFEPESFGSRGQRSREKPMEPRRHAPGDDSSFEGATYRPAEGGEERIFPYGGPGRYVEPSSGLHQGKGPKGYRRSDERIREEVCEMLTENPEIDASEMEVEVHQGMVTLTGSVESRRMKRMTEDLAERIAGVRDVRNELRIPGHDWDMEREPVGETTLEGRPSGAASSKNLTKDRGSRSRSKAGSSRPMRQ